MSKAYIKFTKCTIRKCTDTKSDIYVAFLQMRSTPLGPGMPCPAMLLFNCPRRGFKSIINRWPVNSNNDDDEHYDTLVKSQTENDKNHVTSRN